MFRYHISLGTSTRVPRDLISGALRMVSCIASQGYSRIRARREMGKVAELISFSTFVSISSPFDIFFYFGSQGWMGSSENMF
jgi:hypothetical protein